MLIIFPVQRKCPDPRYCVNIPESTLYSYEGDNFVLDQQVVRAAVKSFRSLFSSQSPSASTLSSSSYYLRLLLEPSTSPPDLSELTWQDPATSILLLEWRAALLVREYSQTAAEPDASVNQRVSKAATEAFIAAQVGQIIRSLSLPACSVDSVRALYILVSLSCVRYPCYLLTFAHSIYLRQWKPDLWTCYPSGYSVFL